jgi:hypothetical protein
VAERRERAAYKHSERHSTRGREVPRDLVLRIHRPPSFACPLSALRDAPTYETEHATGWTESQQNICVGRAEVNREIRHRTTTPASLSGLPSVRRVYLDSQFARRDARRLGGNRGEYANEQTMLRDH